MKQWAMRKSGFTIVELLVVIVVIAILASISIIAYTGVQNRASDARRESDIQTIKKSIEAYKASTGAYPAVTSANQDSSAFETSYVTGSFLDTIKANGIVTSIPVDPTNNSTYFYRYFLYDAGSYGCDASRGKFYILAIKAFQGKSGSNYGPGFSCSGRDWAAEGAAWVTGGFTN